MDVCIRDSDVIPQPMSGYISSKRHLNIQGMGIKFDLFEIDWKYERCISRATKGKKKKKKKTYGNKRSTRSSECIPLNIWDSGLQVEEKQSWCLVVRHCRRHLFYGILVCLPWVPVYETVDLLSSLGCLSSQVLPSGRSSNTDKFKGKERRRREEREREREERRERVNGSLHCHSPFLPLLFQNTLYLIPYDISKTLSSLHILLSTIKENGGWRLELEKVVASSDNPEPRESMEGREESWRRKEEARPTTKGVEGRERKARTTAAPRETWTKVSTVFLVVRHGCKECIFGYIF